MKQQRHPAGTGPFTPACPTGSAPRKSGGWTCPTTCSWRSPRPRKPTAASGFYPGCAGVYEKLLDIPTEWAGPAGAGGVRRVYMQAARVPQRQPAGPAPLRLQPLCGGPDPPGALWGAKPPGGGGRRHRGAQLPLVSRRRHLPGGKADPRAPGPHRLPGAQPHHRVHRRGTPPPSPPRCGWRTTPSPPSRPCGGDPSPALAET